MRRLVAHLEKEKDDEAISQTLTQVGWGRLSDFLDGVKAYRHSLPNLARTAPLATWQEGTTRLLHYPSPNSQAKPVRVMVIPSLVNRYYVMDLLPERSFLLYLQNRGIESHVVDWDRPGEIERDFGLEEYIHRLERIFDHLQQQSPEPVFLLGYCMGGLLALALALVKQKKVKGLLCLATPFDFHTGPESFAARLAILGPMIEPYLQQAHEMPVDLLQACFAHLDPVAILQKFRFFSRQDPDNPSSRHFIALEDWLNDGVPLTGKIAKECLLDWYRDNKPARNQWRLGKKIIRPETFFKPAFFALPSADRIVPPQSARALAARMPKAHIVEPQAGHIGMMVGSRAQQSLWGPLCDWLHETALF